MTGSFKRGNDQHIVAAKEFSLSPRRVGLTESDRTLLRDTFLRLDQLVQTDDIQWEDALLLLTTCRNSSYTLDAMYAEALKWCAEREGTNGFAVALDRLNGALSGDERMDKASAKAATVLEVAATFLSEMQIKYRLYFERFEETRAALVQYAQRMPDPVARKQFLLKFAEIGSGPGTDADRLLPPDQSATDIYLERLREWFALTRPLTSLARTYISSVLGAASPHPTGKDCNHYLAQIQAATVYWEGRGLHCPPVPPPPVFEKAPLASADYDQIQKDRLRQFVAFCLEWQKLARIYVAEKLPAEKAPGGVGFRLKRVPVGFTVEIRGHRFELKPEMFVMITDMRNSTGEPHRTPELKVFVEEVIKHLRDGNMAKSQTLYDDCRVIATETIGDAIACIKRLHEALEPLKAESGFAGIRIGFTRGEMLFDLDMADSWNNIRQSTRAPLDSAENTIARAARLMGLDKLRWQRSDQGSALAVELGDWVTEGSLVFFDDEIKAELSSEAAAAIRDASVLYLKGIGRTQCWALPVALLK